MKTAHTTILIFSFLLISNSYSFSQEYTEPQDFFIRNFKVQTASLTAILTWNYTNTNTDNHFIIERSTDKIIFTPINDVKNIKNSKITYSFQDNLEQAGIYYYRIKLYSLEGGGPYTNTIEVFIAIDTFTPFSIITLAKGNGENEIRIEINENTPISVQLYTVDGRQIYSYSGNSDLIPSIEKLPTGIYLYNLAINKKIYRDKFYLP
jgi:hypothetical protein